MEVVPVSVLRVTEWISQLIKTQLIKLNKFMFIKLSLSLKPGIQTPVKIIIWGQEK